MTHPDTLTPALVAILVETIPEYDFLTADDWQAFARYADVENAIGEYQWSSKTIAPAEMNTTEGDAKALRELITRDRDGWIASLKGYFGPVE